MRLLLATVLAALLAGCAGTLLNVTGVQPGTPRQDVLTRLGTPTRVVPLPQGERLQYSLQPYGQEAWMVDLDATGRVAQVRQVLNGPSFDRIVPGQWTVFDVQREFGPPARIDGVSSWRGPIFTYRWLDVDRSDMFYYVYMDAAGVVQRAHRAMEHRNAPNDRD